MTQRTRLTGPWADDVAELATELRQRLVGKNVLLGVSAMGLLIMEGLKKKPEITDAEDEKIIEDVVSSLGKFLAVVAIANSGQESIQ